MLTTFESCLIFYDLDLGIDKRIKIAHVKDILLNPIQNDGQLKLTCCLNFDRLPAQTELTYTTVNFTEIFYPAVNPSKEVKDKTCKLLPFYNNGVYRFLTVTPF